MRNDYLIHHGILGMKWGIRRYQNPDGTLTPLGRERLGYDKRLSGRSNEDFTIKKGTKGTRVVGGLDSEYLSDPKYKKYYYEGLKERKAKEKNLDTKYLSIDNVRNSGRQNGKEYYMSWFSDSGWSPNDMYVDTYSLKKDVRVASGQKVIDELLKQVGDDVLMNTIKEGKSIKSLTLKYTQDKQLFKNVNDTFIQKGYDAIEDINDPDTDMPVIFLNSKDSLSLKYTQSGKEAIEEFFREQDKKKVS